MNSLRYPDDTTLITVSKEELKHLLMKVKKEREKAGLKLNIQKTKNMAFSPITAWMRCRNNGNNGRFYFLGLQITVDGDFSHKIKRHLLLGRNFSSVQFSSVTQSCLTLCYPMSYSRPGLPVHHQLPEFTQTHVH